MSCTLKTSNALCVVRITYLDSVENDCHDVSFAGGLPVFGAFMIAAVSQLAIVVGPSIL